MASLVGDSMQRPPAYSAVKVGGRKLYDAAREGRDLEAPPRPIRVDAFELVAFCPPGRVTVKVTEAPDASVPPTVTVAPVRKPVPVTVTLVPPVTGPVAGDSEVTAGTGAV